MGKLKGNMTYLDIMRHAHAESIPGMNTHLNWARPLSAKGIEQAKAARARYNGDAHNIKMVLHSPAPRALCTAAIAVGENANPKFVQLDSLWVQRDDFKNDGEVLWKAFDDYGYEIERYLVDNTAFAALQRYALRVNADVERAYTHHDPDDGSIVIVVGHAVFSNFVAFYATGCRDHAMLHTPFGEASRMRLKFGCEGYIGHEYNP